MTEPSSRPERSYLTTAGARRSRTRALVGAAAVTAALVWLFFQLPAEIPIHLTLSSEPDLYGPRWTLFILIAVFVGLIGLTVWSSTSPEHARYPVPVTPRNAQRLYELGEKLMLRVANALMVIYLGFASFYFGFPGFIIVGLGMLMLIAIMLFGIRGMLEERD
ncbi:DUF1648 domain-containing protein [Leucobacter sp. GX24907]